MKTTYNEISDDSGSPAFYVIGNEECLLARTYATGGQYLEFVESIERKDKALRELVEYIAPSLDDFENADPHMAGVIARALEALR